MKQTDWLRWIPYGRFLVDNCAKLQVNHLLLVYQRLVFAPSPAQAALDLQIQTPLDFHISRIAIAADDSVLAAHEAPLIIKTPQGQLRRPTWRYAITRACVQPRRSRSRSRSRTSPSSRCRSTPSGRDRRSQRSAIRLLLLTWVDLLQKTSASS